MTTKKSTARTKKSYKELLQNASKMRGQSGVKAFDRTKILCMVFDDSDFRADLGNVDDFRAAKVLDDLVEDLCLGFFDLRAMLEHYPRRQQWADGKLLSMHDTMVEERSEADPAPTPKRKVQRCTVAQLQEEREKREQAEAKAQRVTSTAEHEQKKYQGRLQFLNEEIDRLKARIKELEDENTELRRQLQDDLVGIA